MKEKEFYGGSKPLPYNGFYNILYKRFTNRPKIKKFPLVKKQPVGERLGASENERLSFARAGDS